MALLNRCSGVTARLISKFRPRCPIVCGEFPYTGHGCSLLRSAVTRNEQTARQLHLSRGVYPVHYPEPRGIPSEKWQIDVDNRIRSAPPRYPCCWLSVAHRFGLRVALQLGIVKPEATVMAVQGWKGGLGHVNTTSKTYSSLLKRHPIADQYAAYSLVSRHG